MLLRITRLRAGFAFAGEHLSVDLADARDCRETFATFDGEDRFVELLAGLRRKRFVP